MKTTFYVPIYNWGELPTTTLGASYGCQMYSSLQDLYGFERDRIVGYYEVTGILPTQEEFEKEHGIVSSGAV